MLASALEFGGAPSLALGALLQVGKTLDAASFAVQVVPVLSKLFASTDRTIRRSLLESIDTYGKHITEVRSLPRWLQDMTWHDRSRWRTWGNDTFT